MGLFGLFSRKPQVVPEPAPAPTTVVIDEDLASRLNPNGEDLQVAINATLREFIESKQRDQERTKELEGIPFWLRRERAQSAEIEDELRDRVTQRQTTEAGR